MKKYLISLFIVNVIFANEIDIKINIKVEQNIKALYKDLDLTQEQKEYVEENEENNINALNAILLKETMRNIHTSKNINDKNIVQFELNKNGKIDNIKLILKAQNKQLNKNTISTIEKVDNKLVLPKEKITLRYIFKYDIKNKNSKVTYQNVNNNKN